MGTCLYRKHYYLRYKQRPNEVYYHYPYRHKLFILIIMSEKADIVIIGAGISGLFAARELSKTGKKVIVLEAHDKVGGRIRKITEGFSEPVNTGAEFIHGNMRLTKSLLKEAGGKAIEKKGDLYLSEHGTISGQEHFAEGWNRVMKELKSLKKDIPLSQFLSEHFGDVQDQDIRESVTRLAEGFDAADIKRISSFAIRDEWSGDSIEGSLVIKEGYTLLINKLYEECRKNGCVIYLLTEVIEIDWQPNNAVIKCINEKNYETSKVLVTVSLGVLLSHPDEKGHILFIPPIPEKIEAAKKIGYGPVIKTNLEFRSAFWNNDNFKEEVKQISDLSFLNSENEFPVWWTKAPDAPFLTGWVGGSQAEKLKQLNEKELFEKMITSLAVTFMTTNDFILSQLLNYSITNWGIDPFIRGAYSYETIETEEAKKILSRPIQNTIYFAGEALGNHLGTVESAMESAKEAVGKMRD
jgi:monoamine oxidase